MQNTIKDIETALRLLFHRKKISSQEVEAWLENSSNKQLLEDIALITDAISDKPQFNQEEGIALFQQYLNKRKRRSIFRYTAIAASIIIIIGFSLFLHTHTSTRDKSLPTQQNQEITLTLANGNTINLGKKTGEIERNATGSIINDSTGKLTYNYEDNKSEETQWNTLRIPAQQSYKIKLSDGTSIHLNANSELRFPQNIKNNQRQVYLKGEAYFDVAPNAQAPFSVILDKNLIIKVLGTKFNVKAYQDNKQIETFLEKGKIELSDAQSSVILHPGEVGIYSPVQQTLETKRPLHTDSYTAWLNNKFLFKEAPIQDVLETLAHWYGIEIIEEKAYHSNIQISGNISRTTPLPDILKAIEATGNIRLQLEDSKLIIIHEK